MHTSNVIPFHLIIRFCTDIIALNIAKGYISQETFPLPTLHPELRRLSHELHFGHGFFVLRGLNPDRYTREENIIIYAGVSSHIGSIRGRQDAYFEGKRADVVLGHIKNISSTGKVKVGSPAYTADKQVFHTDSGNIVSLFALDTAAEGGASRLASTWRVYNHIAATRPDLIHTLSQNWEAELYVSLIILNSFLLTYSASQRPSTAQTKSPAGH